MVVALAVSARIGSASKKWSFMLSLKCKKICNLIGWNSVHISDVFISYSTNVNRT